MKWEETKNKNVSLYQARVADLENSLAQELWLKFFTLLENCSSDLWNAIKVEIWADSGRVIIFPGVADKVDRDEDFCLEFYVESLFDFFECVSDSDIDDDEFDNQVKSRVSSVTEQLNNALQDSQKSNLFTKPNRQFNVIYTDGEEVVFRTNI
tara:strand:+ start:186 stop:644 length:459 start_codon:yes stop_codon:yes gene_type:complete